MNISLYSKSYNEIINRMVDARSNGNELLVRKLAEQANDIAIRILSIPGVAPTVLDFYRKELVTLRKILNGSVQGQNSANSTANDSATHEDEKKSVTGKDAVTLEEAMTKLNELIGLEKVKNKVHSVMSQIRLFRERERRGLPIPGINYHMVFSGNPGTGKTTVARLIAQMFCALGVVKKGHLIEAHRSDLVAEYEGQTAVRTKKVIEKAIGGVLFIDEAYDLVRTDSPDPFGVEAVNTLLPLMENKRNEFVVIIAGYTNEMDYFLETNPGFKSRFNTKIEFDDYSESELLKIFLLNCHKNRFRLSDGANQALEEFIHKIYINRGVHFANGRQMRNLFEDMMLRLGERIEKLGKSYSRLGNDEITVFAKEDVPEDYTKYTD